MDNKDNQEEEKPQQPLIKEIPNSQNNIAPSDMSTLLQSLENIKLTSEDKEQLRNLE
jgi:hypothetical protein